LGYYAQLTALSHLMGLQADAHYTLAAGIGTFGYEPKVSYFFGFPKSIQPGGIALDMPMVVVTASNDGDAAKKKQYTLQTGILSSALEHAVPEQLFTNAQNPGEAISAVKAIQKASAAGQRIYHITPANQSAILGNIHHDSDTMTDIRNAINAGKEVITHTDAVSVPGWTGAGYIITDADTGAGAYKISGGGNGGWFTLLAVASTALLMLAVSPVQILVSMHILIALVILEILTVSLALLFGLDFKTYEDEIAFIGFSGSLLFFGTFIQIAQYLGASTIANQAAVLAIIMEIIVGINSLWKNNK
jgi:hypothetical protein